MATSAIFYKNVFYVNQVIDPPNQSPFMSMLLFVLPYAEQQLWGLSVDNGYLGFLGKGTEL